MSFLTWNPSSDFSYENEDMAVPCFMRSFEGERVYHIFPNQWIVSLFEYCFSEAKKLSLSIPIGVFPCTHQNGLVHGIWWCGGFWLDLGSLVNRLTCDPFIICNLLGWVTMRIVDDSHQCRWAFPSVQSKLTLVYISSKLLWGMWWTIGDCNSKPPLKNKNLKN